MPQCFSVGEIENSKSGFKLNTQLDLKGNIPVFFSISRGKESDVKFLDILEIEQGAYYITDRDYLNFKIFFAINERGAFFVTRAKDNLAFKRVYSNKVDKKIGLRCDQIIKLSNYYAKEKYPEKLIRVKYFDEETERHYVFLANDFNIPAITVANLYKHRWQIELLYKWIKQHLKIQTFWGYSTNAVKTQICIAISAYLVAAIAKKRLKTEKFIRNYTDFTYFPFP